MEDHTFLTHIALSDSPLGERPVSAVSPEELMERPGFGSGRNGDRNGGRKSRDTAFPRLLRINPGYGMKLYLKERPGSGTCPGSGTGPGDTSTGPGSRGSVASELPFEELALRPFPYPHAKFRRLNPGEEIPALDVLATAADEPDYGMDLDLFTDSGTEWGAAYPFGTQPFGNPKHPFTSQAPFHMGFHHEHPLLYRVAPGLRRTWSRFRIQQFSSLAALAFQEGCDYWGYRFAGWGLHYVQDLTMPYHARAVPGFSTASVVARGLLRLAGFPRPYDAMIGTITERHELMERLLMERLLAEPHLLTDALRGAPADSRSDSRDDSLHQFRNGAVPVEEISRRAAAPATAREADRALARCSSPVAAGDALHAILERMLRETGRWTRAFTAWCIQPPPDGPAPGLQREPPLWK